MDAQISMKYVLKIIELYHNTKFVFNIIEIKYRMDLDSL